MQGGGEEKEPIATALAVGGENERLHGTPGGLTNTEPSHHFVIGHSSAMTKISLQSFQQRDTSSQQGIGAGQALPLKGLVESCSSFRFFELTT